MKPTMTYAEVVNALASADISMRHLHCPGHISVIPAAGRVIAMAFAPEGPNLLWSHPDLGDSELVKNHPEKLIGGFGGDRLWFAPELDYYWDGVPDWGDFSNYQVPAKADPGDYRFVGAGTNALTLRAQVCLPIRATGQRVGFTVERTLRMTPAPIALDDHALKDVEYVGIQTSHTVQFEPTTMAGRVDLWHLLQVPVGSLLIIPLKSRATSSDKTPLLYSGSGGWIERPDCILWRYGGTACTKFGLSSRALTGRSGVVRMLAPGYLCLIVRQFAVDPMAPYADHPYGVPRTDQAFQVWDGLGFGEMEYHSPMLDAQRGPRALQESDYLWAFAGAPAAIRALAERLLGIQDLTFAAMRSIESCKGGTRDSVIGARPIDYTQFTAPTCRTSPEQERDLPSHGVNARTISSHTGIDDKFAVRFGQFG